MKNAKNQKPAKVKIQSGGSGTATGSSSVPSVPQPSTGGVSNLFVQSGRVHSKISPSRLKDLEMCPRHLPEERGEVHPITAEGTLCHKAKETNDLSGLNAEQRHWVEMCIAFEAQIRKGYWKRGEKPQVLTEVKLDILDGIFGYADTIFVDPEGTTADLIDYKFGFQLQEDAETNPAAQAYALGMFNRWLWVDQIWVSYLYPRLEQVSQALFHRRQMNEFELRIRTTAARVNDPHSPPTPNTDVCLYCANKGSCPALHAQVLPIAKRYAEGHDEPIPVVPTSVLSSARSSGRS